jgi:hypothetical protein
VNVLGYGCYAATIERQSSRTLQAASGCEGRGAAQEEDPTK